MKWVVARILIALILAFQFQIINWIETTYGEDYTGTVNPVVTITVRVQIPLGPPSGLTLTDLGFVTVQADWGAATNATYYMLRGSRTTYPTTITEGELLGYVDAISANFTSVDLNINTAYVSLWAFSSDNITYNPTYITASIGGGAMDDIASSINATADSITSAGSIFSQMVTSIDSFSTIVGDWLPQIIAGIIVLALLVFALWRREGWLYILAGFAVMFYGFSYITTDWRISILLVILGVGCFAKMGYDYKKRREKA